MLAKRDQAPIEARFERLHDKERIIMIETLRQERQGRGIHPKLKELAERYDWRKGTIITK